MTTEKNNYTIGSGNQDSSTSNQNQKQTQSPPNNSNINERLGDVYGGKIHQREQDVRDILDDQIAGASRLDKKNASAINQAPKK